MELYVKEVIVSDRIRKDLGSVQELAEDIKANGLINPIVVNDKNILLAGERRLEAVKLLGWEKVPITVMQTRDKEHELNIEVSENEARKEFSRAERADYMRRMLEAEKAKAKERMSEGGKGCQNSDNLRADEQASKGFGISRDTLRKELTIAEHQEDMDPEDFADWDEGRLSTNKAYQRLKEKLKESQAETDKVKRELSEERVRGIKAKRDHENEIAELQQSAKDLADGRADYAAQLADKIETLEAELEEARSSEPQVVEKAPADYDEVKKKARQVDSYKADLQTEKRKADEKQRRILELEDEVERLKGATKEGLDMSNLTENVFYFCTVCTNFIGNVGGLVWLTDRISDMSDKEKDMFLKAAGSFRDWASAFFANLERSMNE